MLNFFTYNQLKNAEIQKAQSSQDKNMVDIITCFIKNQSSKK